MKRDRIVQKKVMDRIENADHSHLLFESTSWNPHEGGFSETKVIGWSDEEAYNIKLMLDDGLLKNERVFGLPHQEGGDVDFYVSATTAGHDFLENFGWIKNAKHNIASNVPTVIGSVLLAVFISWATYYLGAPQ